MNTDNDDDNPREPHGTTTAEASDIDYSSYDDDEINSMSVIKQILKINRLDDIVQISPVEGEPAPILLVTSATAPYHVEWVNREWSEAFGWSAEQILGHDCKFLQGDFTDRKKVSSFMSDLFKSGGFGRMKVLNYRKDDTLVQSTIHCTPLVDDCGPGFSSQISHIASVITGCREVTLTEEDMLALNLQRGSLLGDIDEEIGMPIDRRDNSRLYPHCGSLAAPSALEWSILTENLPLALLLRYALRSKAPIVITDYDLRIVHVNVSWVSLTGYTAVECAGWTLPSLFYRGRTGGSISAAAAAGKATASTSGYHLHDQRTGVTAGVTNNNEGNHAELTAQREDATLKNQLQQFRHLVRRVKTAQNKKRCLAPSSSAAAGGMGTSDARGEGSGGGSTYPLGDARNNYSDDINGSNSTSDSSGNGGSSGLDGLSDGDGWGWDVDVEEDDADCVWFDSDAITADVTLNLTGTVTYLPTAPRRPETGAGAGQSSRPTSSKSCSSGSIAGAGAGAGAGADTRPSRTSSSRYSFTSDAPMYPAWAAPAPAAHSRSTFNPNLIRRSCNGTTVLPLTVSPGVIRGRHLAFLFSEWKAESFVLATSRKRSASMPLRLNSATASAIASATSSASAMTSAGRDAERDRATPMADVGEERGSERKSRVAPPGVPGLSGVHRPRLVASRSFGKESGKDSGSGSSILRIVPGTDASSECITVEGSDMVISPSPLRHRPSADLLRDLEISCSEER